MATVGENDSSVQPKRKFNSWSTALKVLEGKDLSGKVVIITGANCGIGFENAKAMAFHGARVVMACRNLEKANSAAEKIKQEKENVDLVVLQCDLASLSSVKNFAEEFKKNYSELHFLICNAGAFGMPHALTEDSLEQTFQVNYLSHVYLIELLLPMLAVSAPSRVVLVSSEGHRMSRLNEKNMTLDNLSPSSKTFSNLVTYGNTKLCMNLITRYLAQLHKEKKVYFFVCHPGVVTTEIPRHSLIFKVCSFLMWPFMKNSAQGAATQVFCAVEEGLEDKSGLYFCDCAPCTPASICSDDKLAEQLWNITQEIIKEKAPKEN